MALLWQMHIGDILLFAIESVDALQIRVFQFGRGGSPVAAVADEHHRLRGEHGGNLGIARAAAGKLYRHAALAGASTVEP